MSKTLRRTPEAKNRRVREGQEYAEAAQHAQAMLDDLEPLTLDEVEAAGDVWDELRFEVN